MSRPLSRLWAFPASQTCGHHLIGRTPSRRPRGAPRSSRLGSPWRASLLCLCLFICLHLGVGTSLAGPAPSSECRLDFTQWPRFEVLSIAEGLSSPRVNDIFQDSRGFLWIATTDGLNRYDGHTLDVFRHDPEDPTSIAANFVAEVAEDGEGKIWLRFGVQGLDRFDPDHGRFEHFRPRPHHAVGFHRSPNGDLILATSDLGWIEVRSESDSPSVQFIVSEPNEPHARAVHCWWTEPSGRLWFGTGDGLFVWAKNDRPRRVDHAAALALCPSRDGLWVSRRDGRLQHLDLETGIPRREWELSSLRPNAVRPLLRLHVDGRGRLWTVDARGHLFHFDVEGNALKPHPLPAPATDLKSDARGFLAVATVRGLAVYDPRDDRFAIHRVDAAYPHGLRSHELREIFIDRDDNVWLATKNSGVQRWNRRATAFRHLDFPRSGAPQEVSAVLTTTAASQEEDGPAMPQVWLGVGNELHVIDGQTLASLRRISLPHGAFVTSMASGRDDGEILWIGTTQGPFRLHGDGRVERCPVPSALRVPINALLLDSENDLWMGTSVGLWQWKEDEAVPRSIPAFSAGGTAVSTQVQALAMDRNGDLWVGTYVGGLTRMHRSTGTVVNFVQSEDPTSLNNRSVHTLYVDSKNQVWVGTYSGGLDLYLSDAAGFQHWTERDGLSGNQISRILEDAAGRIWLATNQGLSRLDPETGSVYSFNRRDGLLAQPFAQHAGAVGPGGTLFVGGHAGLVAFHPDEVETPLTVPRLVWKDVRVDGDAVTSQASEGSAPLRLGPTDRSVSFHFVGLDYSNPDEVRYAFRLVGFEDEWIESGKRDFTSYTNLTPGDYQFQIRAAGSGGIWSDPLEVSVEVIPPFYRRGEFLVGALLITAIGLWFAHSIRLRQQVARTRLLERVRFAERERIREQVARDYHDELGHRLTKLGIFADLLRRGLEPAHASGFTTGANELIHYAERTGQLVESLSRKTREFIWSVDPSKDSAFDLAELVGRFGHDLFDGSGMEFRLSGLDEDLKAARLSPDWKRQLVLLLQEALHNSLRHSEATEVELTFGRVGPGLEIEVRDNGRGFVDVDEAVGNGLRNMKRRAESMGATLEVLSQPGTGTSLRFRAEAS